jgi:hypothetical protein
MRQYMAPADEIPRIRLRGAELGSTGSAPCATDGGDWRCQEFVAMSILVEISPGELFDKITILEIKLDNISDESKRKNIIAEYQALMKSRDGALNIDDAIKDIVAELKEINEKIWRIEDDIRDHERRRDFGPSFVELARGVYINNDHRAACKRRINLLLKAAIIEEKSYTPY